MFNGYQAIFVENFQQFYFLFYIFDAVLPILIRMKLFMSNARRIGLKMAQMENFTLQ